LDVELGHLTIGVDRLVILANLQTQIGDLQHGPGVVGIDLKLLPVALDRRFDCRLILWIHERLAHSCERLKA
jgi:hypothetical protein